MEKYEKIYQNLIKSFVFDGKYIKNGEICNILFQDENCRIEMIVSSGYESSEGFWYEQTEYEKVCILQGESVLEFVDNRLNLKTGDFLIINPHQKHRVFSTSENPPCIWLCMFY